jgi:hypothetical protein
MGAIAAKAEQGLSGNIHVGRVALNISNRPQLLQPPDPPPTMSQGVRHGYNRVKAGLFALMVKYQLLRRN